MHAFLMSSSKEFVGSGTYGCYYCIGPKAVLDIICEKTDRGEMALDAKLAT